MLPGLSVERAPPLTVPLRFLLTAPWFGVLAGALLLWGGPAVFASRWQPALLAATHLLTLGLMAHAMLGALLQLLPVVAGTPVPYNRGVAAIVYPALLSGTVLLSAGFVAGAAWMFRVAVVLLGIAIAVYVVAVLLGFLRSRPTDAASRTLALAVIGLAITAALGAELASAFGWGRALPLMVLTNLHAAWGLIGWTAVLVLAAGIVLVPMFHVTPAFPAWGRRALGLGMFITLALWSAARASGASALAAPLEVALALELVALAGVVLWLQQRGRRRKHPDVTFHLWRLGMLSLLSAVAVWSLSGSTSWIAPGTRDLLLGILLIVGFALSAILGMLYRIVPFLLWLYLQMRTSSRPPNVKQILPDAWAGAQSWLHAAALLTLVAAALDVPLAAYAAGALLALSCGLAGVNLVRASIYAGRVVRRSPPLPARGQRSGWKSLS